jgi:hypothetical protein
MAAPRSRPTTADAAVLTSPGPTSPSAAPVVEGLLEAVHQVVRRVPAELVKADELDVSANPRHGGGADHRDHRQHDGHRLDHAAADAPDGPPSSARAGLSRGPSIFTMRATTP